MNLLSLWINDSKRPAISPGKEAQILKELEIISTHSARGHYQQGKADTVTSSEFHGTLNKMYCPLKCNNSLSVIQLRLLLCPLLYTWCQARTINLSLYPDPSEWMFWTQAGHSGTPNNPLHNESHAGKLPMWQTLTHPQMDRHWNKTPHFTRTVHQDNGLHSMATPCALASVIKLYQRVVILVTSGPLQQSLVATCGMQSTR